MKCRMKSRSERFHHPGGKGLSFRGIINLMPPHRRYVETHLGAGAIMRHKRPAGENIGIEIDPEVVARWRALNLPHVTIIHGNAHVLVPTLALAEEDLLYCDPPYHPSTRRSRRRCYRYDYGEEDHRGLLDLLQGLRCRVILSGYRNELYDARLRDWVRTDYLALTHRGQVVESAWTNFQPGPPLHDYSHIGADFRERERFRRRASGLARRIGGTQPIELHAALADLASTHPEAVRAAAERISD